MTEKPAESPKSSVPGYPPEVERGPDGQLFRRTQKAEIGGGSREVLRPVAPTLAEAKAKKADYYHPEVGWVREGWKLEKDRSTESIMADGSSASPDPNLFPSDKLLGR